VTGSRNSTCTIRNLIHEGFLLQRIAALFPLIGVVTTHSSDACLQFSFFLASWTWETRFRLGMRGRRSFGRDTGSEGWCSPAAVRFWVGWLSFYYSTGWKSHLQHMTTTKVVLNLMTQSRIRGSQLPQALKLSSRHGWIAAMIPFCL